MNPCLSCNNSCFPCMGNFYKLSDEDEFNAQQLEYKQKFSSNQVAQNAAKVKRCISSPGNNAAYCKNQKSKHNLSKSKESKHKEKIYKSENALQNEPEVSRSTEKLKEFLITHADFLDSLYEKHRNEHNEQQPKDEARSLPAELWWVPPLKVPTSRSVPSVAMSNTCSAASSNSTHPRTRRSVEDLRQRVDSVCDLVEQMGIIEVEHHQHLEHNNSCVSTNRSTEFSIPLLKIPSTTSQTSSRVEEELKPHISYKTVGSQCTVVEPKISTDHTYSNTGGSATLRMHTGQPPPEYISASHENNAVRVASPQHASSRYDNTQSNLSVSDLACIHIVNPMLSKLARLCTAQGQQYLTVLEELEKACNDFHNACKYQGAAK